MEAQGDDENDYTNVIENLNSMFSHMISKEVIATLVESCAGDLNLSVDAIMKITNDDNILITTKETPPTAKNNSTDTPCQQNQPSSSYAAQAAQKTGAIQKQLPKITRPNFIPSSFWTDQIREIMTHHNKGTRILILMRGAPGSGKTYLAKLLVESMVGPTFINYKNHILSTDDYFMVRGQYQFDKYKLSLAHTWNQNRAKQAILQGFSPVIIDNTNIEPWEMHPYIIEGVRNGYMLEVVEPNTAWVRKANVLFKKNNHNVPLNTIKRMLENYAEGITGEHLKRLFGLSYPSNMKPPVKRLIPPIEETPPTSNPEASPVENTSRIEFFPPLEFSDQNRPYNITQQKNEELNEVLSVGDQSEHQSESNVSHEEVDDLTQEEIAKQKFVLEAQKRLEEIEKFEAEWENGEKWDESDAAVASAVSKNSSTPATTNTTTVSSANTSSVVTATKSSKTTSLIVNLGSKPPRKEKNDAGSNSRPTTNSLMKSVNECQDWRNMTLFLPPWVGPDEKRMIAPTEEVPVEKTNSSTCVEVGDTRVSGEHKIITAVSRDINEFYIPPDREKIPGQRMLDKSTMTNEGIVMTIHCPQKERHFIAFRKLFKYIKRESLRYIFDNCCGDVNWAVDNILGGGAPYQLKTAEDAEDSDSEEESDIYPNPDEFPCTCLAKYDIIPHDFKPDAAQFSLKTEVTTETAVDFVSPSEKKKRDVTISDETMQIKRQIEQNVVISDSHYSEHCLKLRKLRRGEYYKGDNSSEQPSTSGTPDVASVFDSSNATVPNIDTSDEEDGSNSNISDTDKIVSINVGRSFIKDLDDMFGRKDMDYPDNINFNISIPTSLLNEINALWMESLMFQLDDCANKSAAMVKQDEEFARQIALKEEELLLAGKQPEVPDFKEIMDLEFAISLHLKDMSEWKNNVPKDLAAKMTHEKLYNLFPEIDQDTLLEMLMAHDNNFKATVEVLLMSMGKADILEDENGLNKFVMEKELERRVKMLEEQQKELSESEWPPLPKGETVEMSTVQGYRDEAEQHLSHRNARMQQAEEFIRRGMTQVANYYSELASFHKKKYDQANSMAVASLMQYHANNSPDGETVDLHYFRVKEAKETMDLFIDTHIHKLRETNKRSIMLYFITGRGLHSPGQPKVKPACIKRLRERGLHFHQKVGVDEGRALPLPDFGHRSVCFSCGLSILRASRTYTVRSDRQERNIILKYVPLHLVSRLERVCGACWMATYREVRRQDQHDTNHPILPDVGMSGDYNLPAPPPHPQHVWHPSPARDKITS